MRWWTLLLIAAGLAGGYNWWSQRAPGGAAPATAGIDGFVAVEMPTGTA